MKFKNIKTPNLIKTKTTKEYYQKKLFLYGILSILYVLKYYEEIENYEECQKIINSIKEKESELGVELFTVINEQTIKEVIDTYKRFGLTGKNAIENSLFCSKIIIKEIENN